MPVEPPQVQAPPQPPQVESREQRQPRVRRHRGVVFSEDLFLDLADDEQGGSQVCPRVHRSALDDLEDLFGTTPPRSQSSAMEDSVTEGEQIMVPAQIHQTEDDDGGDFQPESDQEDSQLEAGDETSLTIQRQRPLRHPNSERKMIDWQLKVTRKWLIVGDSNLSRIPSYDNPDLQIDAYPGANFRHAEALMNKCTSHVTVEKVILSFGINHRRQKAKETSVKQLQGAVRAARRKFPYAEVWIPKINFSSALPRDERQSLMILNGYMERNLLALTPLDEAKFRTELDNVHWTKRTGRAMLAHWTSLLNLTAL